ncbi:MAG TPA: YdeI/OmpD-associated family protein [Longimicrobiales bacterium]
MSDAEPQFFPTAAAFRAWLHAHHADAPELWVGFWKVGTGRPSLTWQESVAEALCYGWIDGVRRSIDADSYRIRFTPRRPRSVWSGVNIATAEALIAAGRMQPAGLAAFQARDPTRSNRYSFEQGKVGLDPKREREFRRNAAAWSFFQSQPPSYRKPAIWWVESAKREETRARRLRTLIEDSAAGRRIAPMRRPGE